MFVDLLDFPGMSSQTEVRSLWHSSEGPSASFYLTSGHHPQTKRQSEQFNQDLETRIHCLASQNPASWNRYIMWVEYAHNTLPSASTGLSPF